MYRSTLSTICLLGSLCFTQAACGGASQAHQRTASAVVTTTSATPTNAPNTTATRAPVAPARVVGSIDGDDDGIPDRAELRSYGDRENFRRWFTALAETQFYELSTQWNADQRDCAGLVRFSWREALRAHDRPWLRRMGSAYESVAPDVRAYTLGRGSPLGERLFRTRPGAFEENDLTDDTFSDFADARTLKEFNAEFVSRDRRRAEPGDLLFFHQPWAQRYPYHVMIFLGAAREASEGAADWVVYHTGTSANDRGTIKKVRLAVLDEHPDRRWRPVETNRNFLGFYRLKILR
ncbi:MAG: uncharacterized protein QOG71_2693 [Pyrinomonadaceae bacterium]|nr:uncharacterized protein [Pyrinomonadaceae bacterium]